VLFLEEGLKRTSPCGDMVVRVRTSGEKLLGFLLTIPYAWLYADVCIPHHGCCDCAWVYIYRSCSLSYLDNSINNLPLLNQNRPIRKSPGPGSVE